MNLEIIRRPSLEQFMAAAEVCEIRWSHLRPLHSRQRFEAFQRLGVELVVGREGERFDAVCFVLPCKISTGGEQLEWVSLFQLATRPETKNLGALMFMRIMSSYPTVVGMGVTPEAEQLYKALRWKCYSDIWRGVHPIDLKQMVADYNARLPSGWQRMGLRAVAGLYNTLSSPLESLLALRITCRKLQNGACDCDTLAEKVRTVASYLDVYRSGDSLDVVNAAGIGRVISTARAGLGSLPEHAGAWRELRRNGVKFCEVLLASPEARARAMRLGYLPVRMPLWYQDKQKIVEKLVAAMKSGEISFLHTDKSV